MGTDRPPAYTLPTTYERGSGRITPPRDRLAMGEAAWFCNDCGAERSITTRSPDESAALTAQWHAHTCDPLPERWMVAPSDMPCDLCGRYTRSRSARGGRPCHPVCVARRTARHAATASAPSRATPERAAARRPDRTSGPRGGT
ncbi:hypothetical protein ACIRL2_45920 [Embleya sp. NPDC127516]|uniref:hypothetical protein n=1 Tax=Embleya sp. NPDC127516 TaxID=3363990 RepID=UPI0037FBA053